jgi:aspartate racemase
MNHSRKIGLIGGLSFPSTVTYYDRLNRLVNHRLGKAHSARIVLDSLDFQPIAEWLSAGNSEAVAGELVASSKRLTAAGADIIGICCNTVHKYASIVAHEIDVDFVNICQCTAQEVNKRGARTIALLGSAFSMEEFFYHEEFEKIGVKVRVPKPEDRRFMQLAIERELSTGNISAATRERFLRISQEVCTDSTDALVLACTEIPLLINKSNANIPVIDTVEVHCDALIERAFDFRREPVGAAS